MNMMADDRELSEEEVKRLNEEMAQNNSLLQGSYPEPPSKDSMLQLVRDTIVMDHEGDAINLAKMANFRDEEVGKPKSPVLAYEHYAHYGGSEGYDRVAQYLRGNVGGVAALSLGRKAKLLDSTFTVRREVKNLGTPRTTVRKRLFGPDEVVKEGDS